jgi:16S rRNA (guanine527-N7)-methyltransferase
VKHDITYSHLTVDKISQIKNHFKKHHQKLSAYVDQLLWWNKKINLISREVSRETLMNHVDHSLLITTAPLFLSAQRIIDAGSGGALPGIPLGIVNTDKEVALNDIVSKKMMACKQMVRKIGVKNVSVNIGSIADVEIKRDDLIVSKHAFKINELIRFLDNKEWMGIMLLKGADEVEDELTGISDSLKIEVKSLEKMDLSFYKGKAIVEITKK